MKPFADLKIVELASVLAGPAVGMFFAELGAEVIKIENLKTQGDVTRQWKLPQEKGNVSAYYAAINYNKKSLFLDLSLAQHNQQVLQLLATADVLITNFKLGDAQKFKLDYPSLSSQFPKLIVCEISGFASQKNRVAYDVVLQAESGFMSMNGNPTSGPLKMPVAMIDVLAAHQAKEGVLTALLLRTKSNKGTKVSVTLEEAAIASLANQASNYLMNQHIAQPIGSLHPNIAPYGEVFNCKDGKKVVLAIGSNPQFKGLVNLLNLSTNRLFETNSLRLLNRNELFNYLKVGFLRFNRDEIMQQALTQNIPLGAIKSINEVFENLTAQNMVLSENIENTSTKRIKSVAFKLGI